MGLVDRDERRRAAGQHLGEAGDPQPLGGDEEEVEPPLEVRLDDRARGGPVAAGVDALRPQAQRLELRDLVLHERDERGDDERRAAAGEAGELVAERLAGAGGHDEEHVAALRGGAAHGLLVRPEGGEAEALAQEASRRVGRGTRPVPGSRRRAGLRGAGRRREPRPRRPGTSELAGVSGGAARIGRSRRALGATGAPSGRRASARPARARRPRSAP